jgi:hypothetical protein
MSVEKVMRQITNKATDVENPIILQHYGVVAAPIATAYFWVLHSVPHILHISLTQTPLTGTTGVTEDAAVMSVTTPIQGVTSTKAQVVAGVSNFPAFSASAAYAKDQIVLGADGIVYNCKVEHTALATLPGVDTTNWEEVSSKFLYATKFACTAGSSTKTGAFSYCVVGY